MKGKILLMVGKVDESFVAETSRPVFARLRPDAAVLQLEDVSPLGLVVGEDVRPIIGAFPSSTSD